MTTVQPGQVWRCDEAAADPESVPEPHDTVRLWADHPRFSGIVDEIVDGVAALVVGTSNSHPRAPDLGERVDVHVDQLIEADRWSLKREAAGEDEADDQPVMMADGGLEAFRANWNPDCEFCQQGYTAPYDRGDVECPRCRLRANGRGGERA